MEIFQLSFMVDALSSPPQILADEIPCIPIIPEASVALQNLSYILNDYKNTLSFSIIWGHNNEFQSEVNPLNDEFILMDFEQHTDTHTLQCLIIAEDFNGIGNINILTNRQEEQILTLLFAENTVNFNNLPHSLQEILSISEQIWFPFAIGEYGTTNSLIVGNSHFDIIKPGPKKPESPPPFIQRASA